MTIHELREFTDWGGRTWAEQVAAGVQWLGRLEGLRILEIGARHGGMAIFFATRGARVTGLDVSSGPLERARARAKAYRVTDRVDFREYSGDPQDLPTGYDLVFTKSTIVLMGDLNTVAAGIATSLVPGGRLLAVENARGPVPFHLLRMVRTVSQRPHGAQYFTEASITALAAHLVVEFERWTNLPPTVAVGAVRR